VAAHELRTPMTVLMLGAQRMVLAARAAAPELASKATSMEHSVQRLSRLIETMLDFSRVHARGGKLELEDIDLRAVTDDVVALFDDVARAAGSTLTVHGPAAIAGRWEDLRLRQILTNLVGNAVKYGSGGAIEIQLACDDAHARVSVKDHGIGIAPGDQARVFDRFERAVSQRSFGGLGIGLWLVRENVAALAGSVRVDSELGKGSIFTVELPRWAEAPLPVTAE
jgi:signal transduction histidine kinase